MKNYFAILLFVVLASSCSNKLDEVSLISLSEDIVIDLTQMPTTEGSRLVITLKTINEIECSNAYFSYTLQEDNQKIILDINDIIAEGICNNTLGQITTHVPLQNDYTNNEFEIIIKSSIVNKGVLELKGNVYNISFSDPEGFILKTNQINKILSNSVWGKIYLPNGANENHGSKILTIIEKHQDKSATIINGNYGIFTFYDGGISYPIASNNAIKIFLKYDNWSSFKSELKSYLDSIPDINYTIQNDKGEIL